MARRDVTGPSAGVSSLMATCLRSGIAFTNISTPQPPLDILGNLFRSSTYFGYHSWLGQFLNGELVLRHWASSSGVDAHLETTERHARYTNHWRTDM